MQNERNRNTISSTRRRPAWSLKTIFIMHGETEGSAWMRKTNRRTDASFYLCIWLVYFLFHPPLLDIVLESINWGHSGAPPLRKQTRWRPLFSPAFDIPKSGSIIPDFKNNSVMSCCGTFTWSNWYWAPFVPHGGTLWSLNFSRLWMVTWRLHLSL